MDLYQIEGELTALIERREDETDAEVIALIDLEIERYILSEIRKVDNVRSVWRHCVMMQSTAKAEAEIQAARAKAWGDRLERLKATCLLVMESIPFPPGKPKKLEGKTGVLMLKGNGGKQAVEVYDENLLPDEYTVKTVTLSVHLLQDVLNALPNPLVKRMATEVKESARFASLSAIGEALLKSCGDCNGHGVVNLDGKPGNAGPPGPQSTPTKPCSACGGSGKQGVPGARLAERGQHVECK